MDYDDHEEGHQGAAEALKGRRRSTARRRRCIAIRRREEKSFVCARVTKKGGGGFRASLIQLFLNAEKKTFAFQEITKPNSPTPQHAPAPPPFSRGCAHAALRCRSRHRPLNQTSRAHPVLASLTLLPLQSSYLHHCSLLLPPPRPLCPRRNRRLLLRLLLPRKSHPYTFPRSSLPRDSRANLPPLEHNRKLPRSNSLRSHLRRAGGGAERGEEEERTMRVQSGYGRCKPRFRRAPGLVRGVSSVS